jgi:hypothetical protein
MIRAESTSDRISRVLFCIVPLLVFEVNAFSNSEVIATPRSRHRKNTPFYEAPCSFIRKRSAKRTPAIAGVPVVYSKKA